MSLALIIALGLLLAHEIARTISTQAVNDARTTATLAARLQIQPLLRPGDLREPFSRRRAQALTETLRSELGHDEVARVKLWNRDGRIVYSDDPALLGRRFAPSDELQEAFAGETASEVSDLEEAEQARDIRYGRLVEVYVPLHLKPGGRPAGAFEIYVPYRPVAARVQAATRRTMLLLLGGLAVLWAALFRIVASASKRLRRQASENRHQALHDALTGLPNRALFHDRAAQAVLAARRDGREAAVLVMDLDRFKEINDTLGHHTGDLLLTEVGERLRAQLRASDTVARLGGDEFAVLAPGASDTAAAALARKLRAALDTPFDLGHLTEIHVEASVGVAVYPNHGTDADALLQHADVAMYAAKDDKSGTAVYDHTRDEYSPDRLALVGELRGAIERDELVLHYQPKVDLSDPAHPVQGVEALVRWQHPQRGLVQPAEFIPPAEHTSLMRPLTLWVVETALRQWRVWQAEGIELVIAVNLSAANLADPTLADAIDEILRRLHVPAGRLTLEITESLAMADPARAAAVLQRLHELGLVLAIDDFGTGHSSLAYLNRLPASELKIDRSFIANLRDDAADAVIVRSTIELGHNLGLSIVAEGAEDEETLSWLIAQGCDLVQGYGISRPLPPAELTRWLHARRSAAARTRAGQAAAGAV